MFNKLSNTESLGRASEFYNTVAARRTIRFFSSDPIRKEVIQEIVKAAGTNM